MTAKNSNNLELHYWLKDDSHTMNAFVLNKSEWELLHLIEEISKELKIEISIEAQAIAEGGVKQLLKILNKNFKSGTLSCQIFYLIVTAIIGTPLTLLSTQLINSLFKDKEMIKLEYENKRADIELKKAQIRKTNAEANIIEEEIEQKQEQDNMDYDLIIDSIKVNQKISKRVSNFYEELLKENKITRLTISYLNGSETEKQIVVQRSDFNNFIVKENELESIIDETALIEIISPVLKKGNYQWRGIYKGESLNFNMKSKEFKTLVQTGKVEFKNGTCILCVLKIEHRIDNVGNEIITAYNIENVTAYFVDEKMVETLEGKAYRNNKKATDSQLNIDFKE